MHEATTPRVGDRFEGILVFLREAARAHGVSLPTESDSLFAHGVLDSFGLLEFLGFLEENLGISIPDDDLTPGRFETVGKIREYVESRVGR